MKKVLLLILIFAFILCFPGCEDPIVKDPPRKPRPASIQLRVSHSQITGFTGETRTEQITAIARDERGVSLPDIRIEFSIIDPEEWKGTLDPERVEGFTDSTGKCTVDYEVVLVRDGTVVIEARSGNIFNTSTLNLNIIYDFPWRITVEAPNILRVYPGRSSQATVTASLVDPEGIAVPGVVIHFRTSPSNLGYVSPDSGITDINGRVTTIFRAIFNASGICTTFARTFAHEAWTVIRITSVSGPWFLRIFTDTESHQPVLVEEGENKAVEFLVVVTDRDGNGVTGFELEFELCPYDSTSLVFGYLDPTNPQPNEAGETDVTFYTDGGIGKVIVKVSVVDYPEIEGEIVIDVWW